MTRQKAGAYLALTKPRIVELLLITTVPTMVLAEQGMPSGWLIIATVVGGTLAAGGANATNMVIDRDIDRLMKRTQGRPLVTGEIQPRPALVFAISLQVIAFAQLWLTVNLLSASLAVGAGLFYIFVYSLWLKRSYKSNIVVGGAAGAAPVLVGWAAVTNTIEWPAVVLFVLMFLWTPPHFWALAIKYEDDYAAADVPMLPSVSSRDETARRILQYSIAVWVSSGVLLVVAGLGFIYGISAFFAGGLFVLHSYRLVKNPEPKEAMRVFAFSITFVTVLFLSMAIDEIVRSGW
jgi:heme o synthase